MKGKPGVGKRFLLVFRNCRLPFCLRLSIVKSKRKKRKLVNWVSGFVYFKLSAHVQPTRRSLPDVQETLQRLQAITFGSTNSVSKRLPACFFFSVFCFRNSASTYKFDFDANKLVLNRISASVTLAIRSAFGLFDFRLFFPLFLLPLTVKLGMQVKSTALSHSGTRALDFYFFFRRPSLGQSLGQLFGEP